MELALYFSGTQEQFLALRLRVSSGSTQATICSAKIKPEGSMQSKFLLTSVLSLALSCLQAQRSSPSSSRNERNQMQALEYCYSVNGNFFMSSLRDISQQDLSLFISLHQANISLDQVTPTCVISYYTL